MKKYLLILLLASCLVAIHSCKPMPNDGIPFYMAMDSVMLNPSTTGYTENVTDVWVEVNSSNLGAYELPCNFPVLEEGDCRFVVSAGIMESGQSGVRVTYPFYAPDTFTLTTERGKKYSHRPLFKYVNAAQFSFTETFESGNGFNGFTKIFASSDSNVAYQTACGQLTTNAVDSNVEASSILSYDLPEGQEIWLEINYKGAVPFFAGYYAHYSDGSTLRVPVVFVAAKSYWNKMYIKMSNSVGAARADTYRIYFEAVRPYGSSGGNVYIDNIKLVHF